MRKFIIVAYSLFVSLAAHANMVLLSEVETTPICKENLDDNTPYKCTLDVAFNVKDCVTVSNCSPNVEHYDVSCDDKSKLPPAVSYYLDTTYCANLEQEELYRLYKFNEMNNELEQGLDSELLSAICLKLNNLLLTI